MKVFQQTGPTTYIGECETCRERDQSYGTSSRDVMSWARRHTRDRGHPVYVLAERGTRFTLAGAELLHPEGGGA